MDPGNHCNAHTSDPRKSFQTTLVMTEWHHPKFTHVRYKYIYIYSVFVHKDEDPVEGS